MIYVIDCDDGKIRANGYIRTGWPIVNFILKEDKGSFIKDYSQDYDIVLLEQ
jgi:hypothetical protein